MLQYLLLKYITTDLLSIDSERRRTKGKSYPGLGQGSLALGVRRLAKQVKTSFKENVYLAKPFMENTLPQ